MATPRKPGGYADRQALAEVRIAVAQARLAAREMLDDPPWGAGARFYQLLAEQGQHLGDALQALARMERIRQGANNGSEPE